MTIKHFDNGALVWVNLGREVKFAGKVLVSNNVSTSEHGYELYKVELQQTITGWDGQAQVKCWTHPKPVQGYKLSTRVE